MRKLALLSVFLALPLAGCHVVSPAPATAPTVSIYQQGAQAMHDFAADLGSAQGIEKNLYKGGVIPQPTHKAIEGTFSQIAGYGTQIDGLIAAQASASTIAGKVNSALASLGSIAISAAQLDPQTAAQVNGCIQALQALLSNLLPIFTK